MSGTVARISVNNGKQRELLGRPWQATLILGPLLLAYRDCPRLRLIIDPRRSSRSRL
jgi:hypothetical protein